MLTADFNTDSKLDLAVTNFQDHSLGMLLGNGDGTFQNQTIYSTGGFPTSATTGDFNNDTKLDLAVTNLDGNGATILLNLCS